MAIDVTGNFMIHDVNQHYLQPGETATFQLKIKNTANETCSGIGLYVSKVPPGMTIPNPIKITGDLAPYATKTIDFKVTVTSTFKPVPATYKITITPHYHVDYEKNIVEKSIKVYAVT